MNRIERNFKNLTELWKIAGRAFNSYAQRRGVHSAAVQNSDWPNRIWTEATITEESIQGIQHGMKEQVSLTLSMSCDIDEENQRIPENLFNLKSVQYGMSLLLGSKFDVGTALDFRLVETKAEAELWRDTFAKAFGYNISSETIERTMSQISYFLVYDVDVHIGTFALLATGKVVGIHSLGILPSQRKRGYAARIMRQLLNDATDQKFEMATLQASEMAKQMYLNLGFSMDFLMKNFTYKA